MAANLTPQYHAAEARYRAAKAPDEQLAALEEMWRELPKHKSTEKLQGDLKKKLSAARKALQESGRKGAARVDPFAIPKSGAGQVVLIGTPNVGKSSIVGALTHAHVHIADYPFSTPLPVPGMVPYEDVQIELIDTPPVTAEHVPTGFPGLWRAADGLLVVVDLSSDSVLEDADVCLRQLAERRIELTDGPRAPAVEFDAMFKAPGFVLANKNDVPGASHKLAMLREFLGGRVRIEPVSAHDPQQMARVPEMLFRLIRVIRIYAKPPGRKPDMEAPFVLPAGSDVRVLAHRVYRGLEHRVRSARLWAFGATNGQNVHLDHVLQDRDIVELHV